MVRMLVTIAIIVFATVISLFSQTRTLWSHTYNQFNYGTGEFIRETADGGFVTVGTFAGECIFHLKSSPRNI